MSLMLIKGIMGFAGCTICRTYMCTVCATYLSQSDVGSPSCMFLDAMAQMSACTCVGKLGGCVQRVIGRVSKDELAFCSRL